MRVGFILILGLLAGCAGASPGAAGRSDAGLGDAGAPTISTPSDDAAAPSSTKDAGTGAAQDGAADAGGEADAGAPCTVGGLTGTCISTTACAAQPGYASTPGYCPGPADIECCALTPNVADNPPIPAGYKPMTQPEVTPDMTTWALMILNDPTDYPMFSTTTKTFTLADGGTLDVLARVEWHPPDFQNGVVHRGVTLYEPI